MCSNTDITVKMMFVPLLMLVLILGRYIYNFQHFAVTFRIMTSISISQKNFSGIRFSKRKHFFISDNVGHFEPEKGWEQWEISN